MQNSERFIIDPHIHMEGSLRSSSAIVEYLDLNQVDQGFLIASPVKEGSSVGKSEDMPALQKTYLGTLGNTALGHWISDVPMRALVKNLTIQNPDNQQVLTATLEQPDRLMAWLFANPTADINTTCDDLTQLVEQHRPLVAGVKMHFWVYPIDVDDPRVFEVAEIAKQYNLPILMDVGVSRKRMRHFQRMAGQFSQVPIIAAHLGSFLPEVTEVARRAENVYLDMSGYPVTGRNLRRTMNGLSADKIIFGSDSPGSLGGSIQSQLKALQEAHLNPDEEQLILRENILSLVPNARNKAVKL